MKSKKIILLAVAATVFSASFTACTATSTNTASTNKANTAVVTNASNSGSAANTVSNAASTAANTAANTTSAANTSASAADGEVVKIEEAGIQMTVPKGFKVSKEGGSTLVTTPDGAVEMLFMVPASADDFSEAVDNAAKELDKYIKDVKMEDTGKKGKTADGMETVSSNGSGVDKESGKPVMFDLTVVDAPKKPVLAVSYADVESMKKHATELGAFFNSVKKM